MNILNNQKIAAIIPALNEEKNIGDILKVLLQSKFFNEVVLVDDGSKDKTAEIGLGVGARVIKISKNRGKGSAMRRGAESVDADIIVFFDADLVGLTKDHIFLLIKPMIEENVAMCVGIRGRFLNLPKIIAKIDPLFAIGGERAIRRNLFLRIPEKFIQGFAVEIALNYFCFKNNLLVKYVDLKNLKIIIKEKKWGIIKGFLRRLRMIYQIIKIRTIIIFYKNEFV